MVIPNLRSKYLTLILARILQKNVEHDQNIETRIIAEIEKKVRYLQTIAGKN